MELMRKTIEEKNKIIHELSIQSSSSASSSGMNLVAVHSPGSQAMSLTSSDLTSSTETITSEVSNLTTELFQSRNHFEIDLELSILFNYSCMLAITKILSVKKGTTTRATARFSAIIYITISTSSLYREYKLSR